MQTLTQADCALGPVLGTRWVTVSREDTVLAFAELGIRAKGQMSNRPVTSYPQPRGCPDVPFRTGQDHCFVPCRTGRWVSLLITLATRAMRAI